MILNVTPIHADVAGDLVCTCKLGQGSGSGRVRVAGLPGLTHRGHVIDVDT
jgi:hypothetical protein